jgi:hypothetical protein
MGPLPAHHRCAFGQVASSARGAVMAGALFARFEGQGIPEREPPILLRLLPRSNSH